MRLGSTPSNRRIPEPNSTGASAIVNSSMRPAFTYWRIVAAPPAMRTSRSPATSRAWSSAAPMPWLTKWKMVSPGGSQGSRFSCVTTNTGVWNGASSGQACSPASNMRLPMTLAPVRSNVSRATHAPLGRDESVQRHRHAEEDPPGHQPSAPFRTTSAT
jgi:hypothetical protein